MSKLEYNVVLSFVDDSCWDDRSRWTSKKWVFKTYEQSKRFIRTLYNKGVVIAGRCGPVSLSRIFLLKNISLYKTETTNLKGNIKAILKDFIAIEEEEKQKEERAEYERLNKKYGKLKNTQSSYLGDGDNRLGDGTDPFDDFF